MAQKSKDKVLVGCPTHEVMEYALLEYYEALQKLTYRPLDALLVDNSPSMKYMQRLFDLNIPAVKSEFSNNVMERIVNARNVLRKKVLDEGYTWLLMLEQDVIPPPDIVERLLAHKQSIVSGIYYSKNIPGAPGVLTPMAFKPIASEKEGFPSMRSLTHEEIFLGPKLQQIVSAGLGCVLIHRKVLEKIEFRVGAPGTFDDRWFFIDAFKQDIPVFVDVSVRCKHLIEHKPYSWDIDK